MNSAKLMRFIVITSTIAFNLFASLSAQAARSYWQQEVSYVMEVQLADDGRTLLGQLEFHYRNNSPDTLTELRFHAHYNSFRPGSPAHRRWNARGSTSIDDASPEDYGLLAVKKVKDRQGRSIEIDMNYSIFTVPLYEPLPPGGSVQLWIDFESFLPTSKIAYRSTYSHEQLKVAHWYPQVCVYDPVMGWVDNQYMGTGEAYGEFGTYDVRLTLPEPFIVGSTGVLVNREETLPDTLRELLDIEHYLDWPWEKKVDEVHADSTKVKTWHFHAENVHDFSWVADPTFRIDQIRCGKTDIYILVRQEHASGWYDAAEVTREGMEILEREIGPFPYPEFTVADVFSGMEYPGIVFCGGRSPRYKLLFWHEMAHNYFMGALGSNQTDRSFLDEGFTTYWELRVMEELLGEDNIVLQRYGSRVVWDKDRFYRGFRPYLIRQKSGYILPLHVQSDVADVYLQYRTSSYYKPASMLFALQNLIGIEGIRKVMHHYYDTWKYRHPYEHDFFRCLEETLGCSMEWFYEAWVRGSKSLDYSLSKASAGDKSKIALRIRREGDMIMPVKIGITDWSGEETTYYVPLDDEDTPPDCDFRLPRWDQCRDPHREYLFAVDKASYHSARLDPLGYNAEVNPLNNTISFLPPTKWEFDYPMRHVSPVDAYRMRWAPTAFYNGTDGFQGGFYLKGDYLEDWNKLKFSISVGMLTGRVSAELDYTNSFSQLGRGSTWGVSGYVHEGHRGGSFGIFHEEKKDIEGRTLWEGSVKGFFHELFDREYPPDPALWEDGMLSAVLINGAAYPLVGKFSFTTAASLESAAPLSDFSYFRSSAEAIARYSLNRYFNIALRGFAGSASKDTPVQKWFGLSGGGPFAQAQVSWLRAWASVPPDWNVRAYGDGNLRGYAGEGTYGLKVGSLQMRFETDLGFLRRINLDQDLPPRFRPRISAFLFGGAGDIGLKLNELSLDDRVEELGFGITLKFPGGSELEVAFPVYLSHPQDNEEEWDWRTVIGFSMK